MDNKEMNSKKLPWFYRLVLKLPKLTLSSSSETVQGLFYALVLPILVIVSFFVNLVVLVYLPAPINLLVLGAIISVIFMVFLRIQLERFINSWNAIVKKEPSEWNIEKSLKGYFKLIQKNEPMKSEESED